MKEVKRYIRCTTECRRTGNAVEVEEADGSMRACPLFRWKVSLSEVDKIPKGRKADLQFVEKAEFHLHPTFLEPIRVLDKNPLEVTEEGYGSFDIKVVVHFKDGSSLTFIHGLNLEKARNETHHAVRFKDPSDEFLRLLEANFPLNSHKASLSMGNRTRDDEENEKEGELLYGFDVDELTDRLYSLEGDAIYKAVEVVQRYKTKSTYIEQDDGEFHFDLFTLTPDAVHALWDLTSSYVEKSTSL